MQPIPDANTLPWQRVMALAEQAVGLCDPNPRVGCVLLDSQGRVLGEGHTQAAGQGHAEVMALQDARDRGHATQGSTAVVSLEPCSHHGRTPPCTQALIDGGVAQVFAAVEDPNPLVECRGMAALRSAGIAAHVVGGEFAAASRELNVGFFSRMVRKRPWVRMKVAVTLDGRTALPDGRSQWITGEAARHDGHAWRRRASAVMTGIGTVRADDPRLDVRHVKTAMQPLRVVVDSRLAVEPKARILQSPGEVLIYACEADPMKVAALASLSPRVTVSQAAKDAQGKNDLHALIQDLGARGINELHVEAGEKLNGSLLRAGLVDELLVYIAPKLLGDGLGIAALGSLATLDDALTFRVHAMQQIGRDIRVVLRCDVKTAATAKF
jgi:diaminohydroxyphosphoribosylaminopyrimidine deaminase / 5-amino-6-(5-phosphoribosylamino)uracil reductase